MKTEVTVLLAGLALLCAGPALASDRPSKNPGEKAVSGSASECGPCTRRHESYARIRKQRQKERLTPVLKPAPQPQPETR